MEKGSHLAQHPKNAAVIGLRQVQLIQSSSRETARSVDSPSQSSKDSTHHGSQYGGFHSHGSIPQNGWFLLGKILSRNGWFGGTPISGNHHINIYIYILTWSSMTWMIRGIQFWQSSIYVDHPGKWFYLFGVTIWQSPPIGFSPIVVLRKAIYSQYRVSHSLN